jgi:hypothetical protein
MLIWGGWIQGVNSPDTLICFGGYNTANFCVIGTKGISDFCETHQEGKEAPNNGALSGLLLDLYP